MGIVTAVSVVIPTWNRSALLERAIRSALSQTHPPLEVLVCDDGSTDDSEKVVRSIDDSRVQWLTGERAGRPAVPRNRGIKASRGEWIAFLDDDDVWLPEKLERQLEKANRTGCLAVCCNAFRITPDSETNHLLDWDSECLSFFDLLALNRVICSSVLIHNSLFDVVRGFSESPKLIVGEDYALWLRVSTQTDFAYNAEPMLQYKDDPENSIRNKGRSNNIQIKLVLNDFLDWTSSICISDEKKDAVLHQLRVLLLEDLRERSTKVLNYITKAVFR